jgi:hypothetical protein
LCYTIAFNSPARIQPTEFKVELQNIINPESVYPAAEITLRTMLKYDKDVGARARYFFIDEATFKSGFRAKVGTIIKMDAVAAEEDVSERGYTYRDN